MAVNDVFRVNVPEPVASRVAAPIKAAMAQESARRWAEDDIRRYGRPLSDAERPRVEAAAADAARWRLQQVRNAGHAAQARLLNDLNPLVIAGEMYAGEMAMAGAKGAFRALTSGTMRPGFVRLPTGGLGEAAAEHGRRMAAKEMAASRSAQFKTIEGIQKTITERSSAEAGRVFANQAKGRVVNSTADALKERAAKIAGEWQSEIGGMYRGAFSGAHGAVDWSRTFYSGLVNRTASYVASKAQSVAAVAKKVYDMPRGEIAAKVAGGTLKYASAPRFAHAVATKVPGVRYVVDKVLPTMNPRVREAVLNTLTALQDTALAGGYAYGSYRSGKEHDANEALRVRDEQLGYRKSMFDAYHTNSVYGTSMKDDMDAASWERAAGQLIADRKRALEYENGSGGIMIPGRSPKSPSDPGYIAHGHSDVQAMFDQRMDALAGLPGAASRIERNRDTLFGIMSGGKMTYSDAVALSGDTKADKASRARAKAMVESVDSVFGGWSKTEQAFTDMTEFAKQYLGGK